MLPQLKPQMQGQLHLACCRAGCPRGVLICSLHRGKTKYSDVSTLSRTGRKILKVLPKVTQDLTTSACGANEAVCPSHHENYLAVKNEVQGLVVSISLTEPRANHLMFLPNLEINWDRQTATYQPPPADEMSVHRCHDTIYKITKRELFRNRVLYSPCNVARINGPCLQHASLFPCTLCPHPA